MIGFLTRQKINNCHVSDIYKDIASNTIYKLFEVLKNSIHI